MDGVSVGQSTKPRRSVAVVALTAGRRENSSTCQATSPHNPTTSMAVRSQGCRTSDPGAMRTSFQTGVGNLPTETRRVADSNSKNRGNCCSVLFHAWRSLYTSGGGIFLGRFPGLLKISQRHRVAWHEGCGFFQVLPRLQSVSLLEEGNP